MYSYLYNYYSMHDYNFSTEYDCKIVVEKILENNNIEQKNRNRFENKNHFPWFRIGLTYTKEGNYTVWNDKIMDKINLITVVTLRNGNQSIYEKNLLEIAKKLNWKLFLEEDEEWNEETEIN